MANYLTQDSVAQLRQLLGHLVSADNMQRSQAEQQLNQFWMAEQPDALLLALTHLSRHDSGADIRSFSAVLFRRLAFKSPPKLASTNEALAVTVWDTVLDETRARCMQELLLSLKDEATGPVLHKLSDTIAELYKNVVNRGQPWPALETLLFELCNAPVADRRDCAFRIFASIPAILEGQPPENVLNAFLGRLCDENAAVQLSSMRACVAFLMEADVRVRNGFAAVMPQMLRVLVNLMEQQDDTLVNDALSIFIELAERLPKFFRPILIELVGTCIKIMSDKTKYEELPNFAVTIVPLCLMMMAELEDDEGWYTTDDPGQDDVDENYIICEQAMDRLARALGKWTHILPVSWSQRHAALMAISSIAEGCAKIMEKELGKVIELVLPSFQDAHPRVRYAACNAIGQMSTDFAGVLQQHFHQAVLQKLIPAMDDADHLAADKEILEPYMDAILEKLMAILNTNKMYMQEQAITTIATIADSAQDRFVKFYGTIMPILMNILVQAATREYRTLRGKALECATLIALAVGKKVFAAHAQALINLMIQMQETIMDSDDPLSYYLLQSWARICKVLGPDFAPYLQVVLPPLVRSAQLKPDFTIVDGEEDAEKNFSPEDGWEFVGIDGQQFGIKTTVLDEKCAAVEMFVCYARELGPVFRPYVEQVLDIVLPLLKFYFHEGVRFAAATVIPMLLCCVSQTEPRDVATVQQLWTMICQRLNEVTFSEADPSFLQQLFASYSDCVEELGDNCMTVEQLGLFTNALESQLKEYCQRLKTRQEERELQGYENEDDDAFTLEEEEDDAMLAEMSKTLHVILKTHRDAFFPYFEQLLPFVDGFLINSNPSSRQWALCLVDDIIEFTGAASWHYQSHFLTQLIQAITDDNENIRQAGAYGIGVCAQFGGPPYHEACTAAVPQLLKVVQAPNARDEENVYATESAVAALTKICKFAPSQLDLNAILPIWFGALPMLEDYEEAPLTYTFLLSLLNAQHPALPVNHEHIFLHLGKIFTDVLSLDFLPSEICHQMHDMLKKMVSEEAGEMGRKLLGSLDVDKRATLTRLGYL
ncbi:importin beta-3 subunit [Syncephalis plumigaleata]|nr:importin beta-3 subunit [Syncephalis plumigaleata]